MKKLLVIGLGLRRGQPTPFAYVADHDLAVGEFADYLSKSPIWKESVVLILEDDAQDGPDHVDAHRSPCYLAGGLVKHHFVDHTPYTTTSALPANIDLREKNTASNQWAKRSAGLDFTHEDRVPDRLFNEILWKGIKGDNVPLPVPNRAAFVRTVKDDAGED